MVNKKTYHAVHDSNGNITSIFVTTSSVGTQVALAPDRGCSVTQVDLGSQIPSDFVLAGEEDANRLRELQRQHRIDVSKSGGSLVKK